MILVDFEWILEEILGNFSEGIQFSLQSHPEPGISGNSRGAPAKFALPGGVVLGWHRGMDVEWLDSADPRALRAPVSMVAQPLAAFATHSRSLPRRGESPSPVAAWHQLLGMLDVHHPVFAGVLLVQSQSQRMLWVGGDFKGHLAQSHDRSIFI